MGEKGRKKIKRTGRRELYGRNESLEEKEKEKNRKREAVLL
jgi:hypothetical protein